MLINTLAVPLALGLAVAALFSSRLKPWQGLAFGLAALGVYVLLEGMPALPPVSGKHKLALLIPLAVLAAHLPGRAGRFAVPGFLLAAVVWLGWAKISQGNVGFGSLALLVPVGMTALVPPAPAEAETEFLWPAVLILFGIGAAVLSLLGVFVGFAQAMGALTALLGGAVAVAYLRLLLGASPTLAEPTLRVAVMVMGAVAVMIGLFAPHINLAAFAVLSLGLALPAVAPRLVAVPAALRPFLFGLLAAVPAALAIAIAWVFAA